MKQQADERMWQRSMDDSWKKPKCVIDCNTRMYGVDTADQYVVIRKTVTWPKKVFFYLLHRCLLNSYVTLSKNNPNSRKSFLDFMSDITENLIHHAVSSPSSLSDESQGSSRKCKLIPIYLHSSIHIGTCPLDMEFVDNLD